MNKIIPAIFPNDSRHKAGNTFVSCADAGRERRRPRRHREDLTLILATIHAGESSWRNRCRLGGRRSRDGDSTPMDGAGSAGGHAGIGKIIALAIAPINAGDPS